jgi:hypothetical protein
MALSDWYQIKLFIEHMTGVSMDALHVLVGVILFLLAARMLKRSLANLVPWFATLFLELGNETYDLNVERWPDLGSQLGEGFKDILLTMALPTLLLLAARWRPGLLVDLAAGESLGDVYVPDRPDVGSAGGTSTRLDDKR